MKRIRPSYRGTTTRAWVRMLANAELPRFNRAEQIMSMPAMRQSHWTEAEVRQLIDETPDPTPRFELVGGELLVTPSPGRLHQRLVLALAVRLDAFVRAHGLGELQISPSDVHLAPELVVQPDLFVIPSDEGHRPRTTAPVRHLLLAIEILSPGSARFDRVIKRRAYQSAGVPEYWIVDPDAQTVERWHPGDDRPDVLDRMLSWCPAGAHDALVVDLIALFADVCDA